MRASGPRLQKDLMTTHKPLTLNLIKMLFKKKYLPQQQCFK